MKYLNLTRTECRRLDLESKENFWILSASSKFNRDAIMWSFNADNGEIPPPSYIDDELKKYVDGHHELVFLWLFACRKLNLKDIRGVAPELLDVFKKKWENASKSAADK